MIDDYLAPGAYRVTKAAATLYDATSTAAFTLSAWPSGKTGRLKITTSSKTGHTDCTGTINVGSEAIVFSQAGTKQTTANLIANPVITSTGLDCHVKITVIDVGGADIMVETLTAIDTRIEAYNSGFYNSQGAWTKTNSLILSTTEIQIGDVVRKGTKNYVIMDYEDNPDLGQESDFYSYKAN